MRLNPSALKHGIDPEDVIQAATWSTWIEDLDDDNPARQLRRGSDTYGRLEGTVVLVFDSAMSFCYPRDESTPADVRPTSIVLTLLESSSAGSSPDC